MSGLVVSLAAGEQIKIVFEFDREPGVEHFAEVFGGRVEDGAWVCGTH